MRIFITGATGVIGRRVVPRLLDSHHTVTALARSPASRAALGRLGARSLEVDLFEPDALRDALADHDVVINLATHIPSSSLRMLLPGAWRENDRLRREAAANLAQAALHCGAGRFIQESFAPAYPDRGDAFIHEDTPIAPARFNRTIADAEHAAERFGAGGGAEIVLRFAAFYGPDSRFLREFAAAVRHGVAPLFGPPSSFISSVSHDDAADAVIAALELERGVYNVSDDEPLQHRDYVNALADALGVNPPRLPPAWLAGVAGSAGETMARSLRISNAKLRAQGWAPRWRSVREGFRDAIPALERERAAHPPSARPRIRA